MNQPPANRRTIACLALLAFAFTATHLPPSSLPSTPFINDKILHFCGYAILAAAGLWRAHPKPPAAARRMIGYTWAFLALYALFDESTQPLVGRSCELSDALADFAGTALIMLPSITILHRRSHPS